MSYIYKVENIGTIQQWKAMEKKLNELGKENWELVNFKINDDHSLTGIFNDHSLTGIFKKIVG